MNRIGTEVMALLSYDIFRQLSEGRVLSLVKFHTFTQYLLMNGIAFDTSFSPGSAREAAAVEITIIINPTTTLKLDLDLEPGGTQFTPQ